MFNFDNIMTAEGLAWHDRKRGEPGERHVFRFYHPETVAWPGAICRIHGGRSAD